ncbi:hypothetical protein ACFQX4_26100 [Roseomonas sp. GCM10028921]
MSKTKQEQFLWLVQTAVIVNAVRLSTEARPGREVTGIGLTGNWGAITDAIRASERIPADMDADAAADDYVTYMLENLRREEMEALGHPISCPGWLKRDGEQPGLHDPSEISDLLYTPLEVSNAAFSDWVSSNCVEGPVKATAVSEQIPRPAGSFVVNAREPLFPQK